MSVFAFEERKQVGEIKKDGFNLMEWTVLEHSGTHIDTPIHFSESGRGPDALTADELVVPLAVINVVAKAASFSASLSLATHGASQSVSIRAHSAEAGIKGVSISLRRG